MLFDAIKKEGYTGSYCILTDDGRDWLNGVITSSKSAYVPEIEHPNYAGITLAAALEQEQLSLMPMPNGIG